jgi:lipoic acid synthetase
VSPGLPNPLNPEEPAEIARAVKKMGLSYAVLTSVTRDDLSDGGAGHFCETIEAIGRVTPQTPVECLIPDFQGSKPSLDRVARSGPAVINHNLETVERLYPSVRPGADFKRSLQLIGYLKETFPGLLTKSGIMVGLGETREETRRVLEDLRDQGCAILTIGQYLQPSPEHHPVVRYVTPDEFAGWEKEACQLGFKAVACGPFVRSSFEAEGLYAKARSSPPRRIGDPSPIGEEKIFCCLS